jgi:hypothetical protein
MTSPIAANIRILAELSERLSTLGWTEEEMQDTLQGATNLPEQLAKLARAIVRLEAYADAMQDIVRQNQDRKAMLERQAEKLRAIVAHALGEAGLKKIPADVLPDLGVSMQTGKQALIISDVDEVPHSFCRIKYEPDRKAIRSALEEGQKFHWASLGNAQPFLTIKH